jgi:sulfur relay (sulfurtransferase) complex TusBCD TusD component (DsrE family)
MPLRGKKLGLLLSTRPENPGFRHGLRLAEAAMNQGVKVYIYCIDDAVTGLADEQLQALAARGVNLFACAYGAQRRNIPLSGLAIFAGLTVVSDIVASTDRFVSFN